MRFTIFHFPTRATTALTVFTLVAMAGVGLLSASRVSAHGEQLEIGGGAKGPVTLTAAQQTALGLKLEAATLRPMTDLLFLNGEVRPVAGRQARSEFR